MVYLPAEALKITFNVMTIKYIATITSSIIDCFDFDEINDASHVSIRIVCSGLELEHFDFE